MAEEIRGRLKGAQRIVIKAGTSVVSTPEGYPSLVRLANIVEQVRPLIHDLEWTGVGVCVYVCEGQVLRPRILSAYRSRRQAPVLQAHFV